MVSLELIKEISFKITGISNISLKTKIGEDLGLDGDDAKEFLELIFAKFNFEGKKIPFEDYFNYENDLWGVKNFFNKIFNPKKYISQKDITVGEIIQFIETNKNEI